MTAPSGWGTCGDGISHQGGASDQYTLLQCTALTNVGYEPKFTNDTFAFRETVMGGKTETTKEELPEPMITKDHYREALAAAQAPMFASKTSDIQVVLP